MPLRPTTVATEIPYLLFKREIRNSHPPWHPDRDKVLNPEGENPGPFPPCDSPTFFGGNATISPPETESSFDPVLEDPIFGETSYFFDDHDDLVCMPTTTRKNEGAMVFDTDSGEVGIDNRCSACMSPHRGDFVGKLEEMQKWIKGYGGKRLYDVYKGTMRWQIADSKGLIHEVLIPDSYHVPGTEYRLISPQHWAQVKKDDSTTCTTFHDRAVLKWGGVQKVYPSIIETYLLSDLLKDTNSLQLSAPSLT